MEERKKFGAGGTLKTSQGLLKASGFVCRHTSSRGTKLQQLHRGRLLNSNCR